jgi:hypothetical protein
MDSQGQNSEKRISGMKDGNRKNDLSSNKEQNSQDEYYGSEDSGSYDGDGTFQSQGNKKHKHKRRSKNDNHGRDFKCGCGKRYLSYPALYTHIKTKHNGVTPKDTNTS